MWLETFLWNTLFWFEQQCYFIWTWNHLSKSLFKTFCWVSGPDFLLISASRLTCGDQEFQFTYSMMLFWTVCIDYNDGIFQFFDKLLLYFINCRFTEGLAALGVLRAIRLHPKSMKEIFVSSGPATLTSIIGLMTVNYSAEGSNKRQREGVCTIYGHIGRDIQYV